MKRWIPIAILLALASCGGEAPGGVDMAVPDMARPPDLVFLPDLGPPPDLGPSCSDKVKNGGESDIDCGGSSCPACADNANCTMGTDCASGVCSEGKCAAPSCTDQVKNGKETDDDCGGGTCPPCSTGQACGMGSDCESGVCAANNCSAPSCSDQVKNGDETDVDCGGAACPKCGAGKACGGAGDCVSGVCMNGLCSAASCTDQVQNGDETDVDCGGMTCGKCANTRKCTMDADCQSGVCTNGVCLTPACDDKLKNGSETDVDCGGTCGPCATGQTCAVAKDCASGVCANMKCSAPTCSDAVKNQGESDVDCGGPCAACDVNKACAADKDCKAGLFCVASKCAYPVSCADIKKRNPAATTGSYTIAPPGAGTTIQVACDMTTDGGGWTQLLQCLPGDQCKAGNVVLMNVDWLTTDYGAVDAAKSYAVGKTLAGLVVDGGHFMVQVTDTTKMTTGYAVYPLTTDTKKYFSSTGFYESAPLPAAILDTDGSYDQYNLRVCWTPTVNPFARTLQGAGGLQFLGRTSLAPNANANTGCDYGPWESQMLMRNPSLSTITTTWGMQPVANWGVQPNAQRVWVREAIPQPVTIVAQGTGRRWSDGRIARSCFDYRYPPAGGARSYAGTVGSGVYTIKPDAGQGAFDTFCDMVTDGGGWTMVQRTVWDWSSSQALWTDYAMFYSAFAGNLTTGAYRVPGSLWVYLAQSKEYMFVHSPRKVSDGTSCGALYYKGVGGTITPTPGASTFTITGLVQPVTMINDERLSTKTSGPSASCVNNNHGVPWFYSSCCTTCPTYQEGYWNDEPHPMVAYTAAAKDLFGKVQADTCNSATVISSNGYFGMNRMEFYVR